MDYQNEVNGYLVTGSNGKSIFLPAAGARDGEEVNSVNTNGFYWTGQLWQDFGGSMQWYGYRINFSSTWYEKVIISALMATLFVQWQDINK